MRNKNRLRMYFVLLFLLWTLLILWHVRMQYYDQENSIASIATKEANLTYLKDALYRKWVAKQGGVYVPVSDFTPPNPYLTLKGRDVETVDGRQLTLVNPAYMPRQVFELAGKGVIQGHLTSDIYLNEKNKPDAWEKDALKKIYEGAKSVSEKVTMDGDPYLRFMRPFIIDESCLKCHGYQGYEIGDIRGGISVEVPLKDYYTTMSAKVVHVIISNAALWLCGAAILLFTYLKMISVFNKEEQLAIYKDTLFREFNHRAKNNLQIISGIIDMHLTEDISEGRKDILTDIQSRLVSMSILHNMLTDNKNGTLGVRSDVYMKNLCDYFKNTNDKKEIKINLRADSFSMPNSVALTCGLILNELLTNSYKHAFTEEVAEPEIYIVCSHDKGKVDIEYRDNGIGFSYLEVNNAEGGYGFKLIESMAEKLKADITIDGVSGFYAQLVFALPTSSAK